jgi:hypothetical protein
MRTMINNSSQKTVLGSGLIAIDDRNACATFLSEALAGGGSLSRSLQEVATQFSRCWTLLPAAAGVTNFYEGGWYETSSRFVYDGGVAERVVSDNERMAAMIATYLQNRQTSFCLFENARARRSDAFVNGISAPVVFYADEVFHWSTSKNRLDDIIEMLIRAKTVPVFTGGIGRSSRVVSSLLDRGTVGQAFLNDVIRVAEHIVIGAYDGESYVVFSRETNNVRARITESTAM